MVWGHYYTAGWRLISRGIGERRARRIAERRNSSRWTGASVYVALPWGVNPDDLETHSEGTS
jgi:hypothetical protein